MSFLAETNTQCQTTKRVLSDRDGADPMELRRALVHAEDCPGCAGLIEDGTASSPVYAIPVVPSWLRTSLALLCLAQLVVAVPWLLGYNPIGGLGDHVEVAHLTRDGALGLTTSIAGLLTAWRIRYAIPAILVASVALVAQLVAAFVDDHSHRVSLAFEGIHLITVAVTAMVAMHVWHSPVGPD